jgi:hypothetical protein
MRIILIAAIAVFVSGCSAQRFQDTFRAAGGKVFPVHYSIERFEAKCSTEPAASFGVCVRRELEAGYPRWRSDKEADLMDVYVAWLQAAGERITAGTMSDADMRLGAAMLKSQWKDITSQRAANAAAVNQSRSAAMLTGLALMNSASPQSPQIVCRSTPTGLGTTTTTCN